MFVSKAKIAVMKKIVPWIPQKTPLTYIGEGKLLDSVDYLQSHNLSKLLIVTDEILESLGLLDQLCHALEASNISYKIFNQVTPDPTFITVEQIIKQIDTHQSDSVLAFGGGSVLDCVKFASVAYTNNLTPSQQNGFLKLKKRGLPFIAVPTTCGTGSETTIVSVISDPDSHKKSPLFSNKMIPDVTILDPEVTAKLPLSIAAFTAIDALTHALEAYVSEFATEESNFYALAAIKLIYENLPKFKQNSGDVKARTHLLTASFYAGIAFTRAFVGYVHAFAHQIGGLYGVPHGQANAVLLPYVMEFYLPHCHKPFSEIYDFIYTNNDLADNKPQKLVDSLFALIEQMDVSLSLEKFPLSGVKQVVEAGFKECHGFYAVPAYMSFDEAEAIVRKVVK